MGEVEHKDIMLNKPPPRPQTNDGRARRALPRRRRKIPRRTEKVPLPVHVHEPIPEPTPKQLPYWKRFFSGNTAKVLTLTRRRSGLVFRAWEPMGSCGTRMPQTYRTMGRAI